jgi:uncharacterized Zn finger protein (UPF0148 family)
MEPLTIHCPECEQEIASPDGETRSVCPSCGQVIDVLAHVAFEWGQEVYVEAREQAIAKRLWPVGKRTLWRPLDEAIALPFEQAYGAIREGLRSKLHERQRKASIEMLSEIATVLAQHLMTSPIEAKYWSRLFIEQLRLDQVAELRKRLNEGPGGPAHALQRLWWRFRLARAHRALVKVEKQVDQFEALAEFVEPPRARLPKALRTLR